MAAWVGLIGVLVGVVGTLLTTLLRERSASRRAVRDVEIEAFGRFLASIFGVRSAAVKRLGPGPHRYDIDRYSDQLDEAYDELLQAYAYALLYSQTDDLRESLEEVRERAGLLTQQCAAAGHLDELDEDGHFERSGSFHALREAQRVCVGIVQLQLGLTVSTSY